MQNWFERHNLPMHCGEQPEDIAGVVKFFISNDASYVTGQSLLVDGGLTITF